MRSNRTKIDAISIFGYQIKFDLRKGFPLLTTKKCFFRSIVYELLWFLSGNTNVKYLNDNGVFIWNNWADKNGDLGPIYGKQWRSWGSNNNNCGIDQMSIAVDQIKNNPNSRRIIVSSWNVSDLHNMSIPPCHVFFQFYVLGEHLSCQVYQRSCDVFLGLPFNIASYALLLHMIAQQCKLRVKNLIWVGGDIHLYVNHFPQVKIQLSRCPRKLPYLFITRCPVTLFDYNFCDFKLNNYNPYSAILAPVAV